MAGAGDIGAGFTTAPVGSKKWTEDFIKSLQTANVVQAQSPAALALRQTYANYLSNAGTPTVGVTDVNAALPSLEDATNLINPPDYSQSPGLGSRILDILLRPLYATANLAKAGVKELQGDEDAENPFVALGRGFAGKDKTTFADVIQEAAPTAPKALVGLGGLAGDLALDPVNYIVGPVGAAGLSAVKGATKAGKAAKALQAGQELAAEERAAEQIAAMQQRINYPEPPSGPTQVYGYPEPPTGPRVSLGYSGPRQEFPEPPIGPTQLLPEPYQWPEPPVQGSNLVPSRRIAVNAEGEATSYAGLRPTSKTNPVGTPESFVDTLLKQMREEKASTGLTRTKIDEAINAVGARVYPGIRHIPSPYEGMRTAAREIRTPEAQRAFVDKYKSLLRPEDFAYLQKVRYPQQWRERVDEIVNRLDPGRVTSVQDFVSAAKNGELPADEIEKVLKVARVDSVDQLPGRYAGLPAPIADKIVAPKPKRGRPKATPKTAPKGLEGIDLKKPVFTTEEATIISDAKLSDLTAAAERQGVNPDDVMGKADAAINHNFFEPPEVERPYTGNPSIDVFENAQAIADDVFEGTAPGAKVVNLNETIADKVLKPSKVTGKSTEKQLEATARLSALSDKADQLLADLDAALAKTAASSAELGDLSQQAKVVDEILSAGRTKINSMEQAKRLQSLVKASGEATRGTLKGTQQQEIQRLAIMQELKTQEAAEVAAGNMHTISSGVEGAPAWPMSTSQVLSVLSDKTIQRASINFQTFIAPTAVQSMAARALDLSGTALSKDQFIAELERVGRDNAGPYKPNNTTRRPDRVNPSYTAVAKDLYNNQAALKAIALQNMQAFETAKVAAGTVAARAVVAKIGTDLKTSVAQSIEDVANPDKLINQATQGNTDVKMVTAAKVAEYIAKVTSPVDTQAAKIVEANVRDTVAGGVRAAKPKARSREQAKMAKQEAQDIIKQHLGYADPADFDGLKAVEVEQLLNRKVNPIVSLTHAWGYGAGEVANNYKMGFSAYMTMGRDFSQRLMDIKKSAKTPDDFKSAWTALQNKSVPTNQDVLYVYGQLKPLVDQIFDTSGSNPMLGTFFRDGYSVKDINEAVKEQGLKFQFETKLSGTIDPRDPRAVHWQVAESWRRAQIDDPVDFLEKMYMASLNLHMRAAVGAHFGAEFGVTAIPAGAAAKGIHYAKMPKVSAGADTKLLQHVPTQTLDGKPLYYQQEALDQLFHLERILKQSKSFQGSSSGFGKFITNVADPTLAIWKPMVTIIRPGHHIRNGFGDLMLNFLDGVYGITPYKKAALSLKAGGVMRKEAIEQLDEILKMPEQAGRSGPENTVIHLKGGKKETYDSAGMYKLAYQDGVLPGFHQTEDILMNQKKTGLQGFANRILASTPVQAGGKVAELSSHYFRLAQYNHLLSSRRFTSKFRTLDEARRAAATRVKRFHPDTTGLSPESMKYMRRIFPFYSWIRQIIPVVFETMLTKPARLTAIDKIYWGINNAFNPNSPDSNSIIDPFPVTRLIPSFLRDNLGYAGGSFTFSLGSPTESVFGDILNGNPQRNLLAMLNPAIKAPIELSTNTNLGTGAYIPDKGEYLDQLLPGVGQVASISGFSPSGTVANWFTGASSDYPLNVDPQRSLAKGEKNFFFNQSLFNFLTGLGVQNFDRDSYYNIASREITRGGT